MRRGAAALWLLVGCDGGPDEASRLERLQIVAMVVEPPQPEPAAAVQVSLGVADPAGRGSELLVWFCTAAESGGCEESSGDGELPSWRAAPVDGIATLEVTVPESPPSEERPWELWALACEPGSCAALQGEADVAALEDPAGILRGEPIDGTSLVARRLSPADPENDAGNPALTPTGSVELAEVGTGTSRALAFTVAHALPVDAFGYATRGVTSTPTVDGDTVRLRWFAEDEPGEAELWVVVEDGLGGSAFWRGRGSVVR